jgi:class 3 adenylate cyclase
MEAPELERRLAAIVAADVEGYSRLMHRDEEMKAYLEKFPEGEFAILARARLAQL